MKFIPHDYQRYATRFIEENPIAAVLLSMGLGKTVVTLTAIYNLLYDSFEVRRVLVVAPLRVARDTWPEEIEKWDHLRGLRYAVAVGTPQERRRAVLSGAPVVIINRENVQWLVETQPWDFDMVVVDELSSFKSHKAKRFRALMQVRPRVKRIVGLTGTPTGNGLMDLWAEYKLLDMGERLGRYIGQYRNAYFQPDKRNAQVVFSYKPLPGAEQRIYDRVADITISMKAGDYLHMPELVSSSYTVCMDAREQKQYEELKQNLILPEMEITAANAAILSGKLSQMANGAVYSDDGKVIAFHDRKLDALEDLVEASLGEPLMVAYWYRHDLERIKERLGRIGVRYAELKSSDSMRRWNEGSIPVGLIHPASAGHGVNLQRGGSHLVWFGLTWSLELYQQTNARLWRQGQAARTVVIQHIVTKGTVDERILTALEQKDVTQARMIEAVKAQTTHP